ncbi:MAG: metalloregulator ArsR/SmtB family transcription factor [Phycisphaerales bacterium]
MKQRASIPATGLLAAMADTTRLRLLRLLECHELSVGEVALATQLPQSTVSRHLKVLADAELLVRRSEGTASYFSLVQDDMSVGARTVWGAVRSHSVPVQEKQEDERRARALIEQRRVDSSTFFGSVRGDWEGLRVDLFGARFTGLALLGLLPRAWVVADLGCGTGSVAEALAPHVERVHAVDASGPMMTAARQRMKGSQNVTFTEASAEETGLRPASVDAAVCALLLHHVDAPLAVLLEARRLLRSTRGGGRVLVIDMVSHDREVYRRTMGHRHLGFSRKAMLGLLSDAGFADTRYVTLPVEPEAKGPGLFVASGVVPG